MRRIGLPSLVLLSLFSLGLPSDVPPGRAQPTLRKLTYPGRSWSLVVDLPGFEFEERATRKDLTGIRVFGENKRTGVVLSIFLEKAEGKGGAETCRAFYWSRAKRATPRPQDVRFTERKNMALVEYTTSGSPGEAVRMDNVSTYMSHDGVWIETHLSKDGRMARDRVVFDTIVDSARIVEMGRDSRAGSIAVSAPIPPPEPFFFQAPGKEWGVLIEAPGAVFEMTPLYEFDRTGHEITQQRVTGNQWNGRIEKTGLVLWVALATVDRIDANQARDLLWETFKRGEAGQMTDITRFERGEWPIVEYRVPLVDGKRVDIKNTLAFLGRDGVAGIIMISKVDYRPEDASAFETVIGSIRIAERAPTPP
jgi:hypothetical protein